MATEIDRWLRETERQVTDRQVATLLATFIFLNTSIHKFYNQLRFCVFVSLLLFSLILGYFFTRKFLGVPFSITIGIWMFTYCPFSFKIKMQVYVKTKVNNELIQLCQNTFALCCVVKSKTKIGEVNINKNHSFFIHDNALS